MSTFIPEFTASGVAAFIGKHAYQPVQKAYYDALLKDPVMKMTITNMLQNDNLVAYDRLKGSLLKDTKVRSIVENGMKAFAENPTESLEAVDAAAKTFVEQSFAQYPKETRDALIQEVRGQVAKQRGVVGETAILNTYEVDKSVAVTDRNARMIRKDCGDYKLAGRVDGYVEEHKRVVDAKRRLNWRPTVPEYDIIQLRVYMYMMGAVEGELIENFPDQPPRVTRYTNDPSKWEEIHQGILAGVATLREITTNPDRLRQVVFANTTKKS